MLSYFVSEKEFIVNEHVTLKLEHGKTILYINGEKFRQCMRLILQIPLNELAKYDSIDSINEAAELNKSLHENHIWNGEYWENKVTITPEQEFWGHCSNIQAWYENDYDTRLIHSNLAFPLLEQLAEVGEKKARTSLKDEIALLFERWLNGPHSELAEEFFKTHTLLHHLNKEEQYVLFKMYADKYYQDIEKEQTEIIIELGILLGKPIPILSEKNQKKKKSKNFGIEVKRGKVISLKLFGGKNYGRHDNKSLLKKICQITTLIELNLSYNKIEKLPTIVSNLNCLEEFDLSKNNLTSLPESIGNIKSLKTLILLHNKIKEIPESIGNIKSLKIII